MDQKIALSNFNNRIFLSDLLKEKEKYRNFYNRLTALLQEHNIPYTLISDTKDIWCRDFMPIYTGDKRLVSYRYDPDYLKKYPGYRSDFTKINKNLKLDEVFDICNTDIVLDGGNVIKYKNSIIMTDKIFSENPHIPKDKLLKEIAEVFQIEKPIIIPWDKNFDAEDFYGHSDGMIRFVDDRYVLINGFIKEYPAELKTKLFEVLKENSVDYEFLETDEWGYLNFLQLKDTIILPVFNTHEDRKAKQQIKTLYPDYRLLTVNASEIHKEGGVLNCISWTLI